METVKMTAEEKQQYDAFLEQKEKESRKAKIKENRDAYKVLVDETINGIFPNLIGLSKSLAVQKTAVYESFQKALQMKAEIYDVKPDQRSNTFTNAAGTHRVTLGQYTTDDYDDTVNEGIGKVKEYISSLAKDAESSMLVKGIMQLLARDQKGNLKASRVMQLRKMAEESNSELFIDGVKIIEAAYRPAVSKFYVKAEMKDVHEKWVLIPLGMTEA